MCIENWHRFGLGLGEWHSTSGTELGYENSARERGAGEGHGIWGVGREP